MTSFLAKLFSTAPEAKIEALAAQVADASRAEAAELLGLDLSTMALAEARGYVRARCGKVVRRYTRKLIHQQTAASIDWAPSVASLASEKLSAILLKELRVGLPRTTVLAKAA